MIGYHKNYTPTIESMTDTLAVLVTPEIPGGNPKVVKVGVLEKFEQR